MKTLYYRVTLIEPTILTAIDGEPNSSVSYDFIPGAVMRGFFISEMLRQFNLRELNLKDDLTKRLFFSSQTRYLNAYPVINSRRGLPVPASWRKRKYMADGETKENYTIRDETFTPHKPNSADPQKSGQKDTDKWSSVEGFVAYDSADRVRIYKPDRVLNVHIQRARRNSNEQQVYRYDALAPQQTFEGMVLCDIDDDTNLLEGFLNSRREVYLGGARSAGYGLAQIEDFAISDTWLEVEPRFGETVVLTLLSDVILRDVYGQYAATLDALQLALNRAGMTFEYGEFITLQTTLIGGFNRKWGLPLPQTPALKRGSVLTLLDVRYDEERLWQLLWTGMGERTNEGFGQLAFNWQQQSVLQAQKYARSDGDYSGALPQSDDGQTMYTFWSHFKAQADETRLITQQVYVDHKYRIVSNSSRDISPTQLARLRAKIADELRKPSPSLAFLKAFLDDISGKADAERTGKPAKPKAAGKQFNRAIIEDKIRVKTQTLMDWLYYHTSHPDQDVNRQLRLLDTVLERAHKERTRKQRNPQLNVRN